MKLSEFIQRNIGCKVDFDGFNGPQCVDLFRQYDKDVLGIPRTEPVEGAKDLFLKYDSMPKLKKYFVAMKTRDARYGDVIVYGATEKNRFGHVAIAVSTIDDNTHLVFEQDGFKQDGAKLVERNSANVIGILRYRGIK
ncbi:MAG: CHAP domain-containing protein [Treponema sp.]|nr:CHAP domain-containing protein [Treponema sp.]